MRTLSLAGHSPSSKKKKYLGEKERQQREVFLTESNPSLCVLSLLSREGAKKEKERQFVTTDSQVVTNPSTNVAQPDLTNAVLMGHGAYIGGLNESILKEKT